MSNTFPAFVIRKDGNSCTGRVEKLSECDLPEGDLTVRVAYSGVNYKDALASLPEGKVVKTYPMVPGIDLSGVVVRDLSSRFRPGDRVIITGYHLGVSHFGGFCAYARVPSSWAVPLPEGLTMREAMLLGTAGFTAGMAVKTLQDHGLPQGTGPVLVTGATGGVGSTATAILARAGYRVTAVTGKREARGYLEELGAAEVLTREEIHTSADTLLAEERWAGAIDPVGGEVLPHILKSLCRGGAVALIGLTGGAKVNTSVFPFILRGVALLGIDSVFAPRPLRSEIWNKLSGDWKPISLSRIAAEEIPLTKLPTAFDKLLQGEARGRILVRLP